MSFLRACPRWVFSGLIVVLIGVGIWPMAQTAADARGAGSGELQAESRVLKKRLGGRIRFPISISLTRLTKPKRRFRTLTRPCNALHFEDTPRPEFRY
jgi:hypothetical protein